MCMCHGVHMHVVGLCVMVYCELVMCHGVHLLGCVLLCMCHGVHLLIVGLCIM